MFVEFLIAGSIVFQVLGPRYLKHFTALLAVLSGPVVKSICDQRNRFRCSKIH